MIKRHLVSLLGIMLLAAGAPAGAASISLQASQPVVEPLQPFTIALLIDAIDVPGPDNDLFGGEVVIDFDPAALEYTGISLSPGVSFYLQPALALSGDRQTLVFGFDNAPESGTVAMLSFTAVGSGGLTTVGIADHLDLVGSFASYYPGYQRFYPEFAGTSVQIVPLPGAAWLMLSAFGATALRLRRKTQSSRAAR